MSQEKQRAPEQSLVEVRKALQRMAYKNTSHTHVSTDITDFNEASQDVIGAAMTDGTTIDFTYSDAGGTITAEVKANSIAATYMHATATDVLFGRSTAAAGAGEEVACTAAGRTFIAASTAAAETALLNTVVGDSGAGGAKGLAPATGAGDAAAGKFLKADATWAVPLGTYAAENAQDDVGGILTDTATVDFTYNDIANTITADVIANSISNSLLRDSGALSVIGRSANSSGDPADISAVAASDSVLRESGSVLGFGTIATAGIANTAVTAAKMVNSGVFTGDATTTFPAITIGANAITDAKFRQGVARSVVGVTGNATANTADIQGTTDQVLRVTGAGTALSFGAIDLSKTAAATGVLQAASMPALSGDISNSAGNLTTAIGSNKVTLGMMATIAQDRIIGGATGAGTATPTALTVLPTGCMPALTGDVTNSAGALATTIANDAVSNAKIANMANATIKGRTTAGTGDPEDMTATQTTALLNNVVGDSGSGGTKGLVPAPAAGDAAAGKYLKSDGTWTAPPAGTAAAQSDQETATSTTLMVTPGRQHFHPGHTKCWCYVKDNGSGTFQLQSGSYGVSSITDGATGVCTVTYATAFSSATLCSLSATRHRGNANGTATVTSENSGNAIVNIGVASGGTLEDGDFYFQARGDFA